MKNKATLCIHLQILNIILVDVIIMCYEIGMPKYLLSILILLWYALSIRSSGDIDDYLTPEQTKSAQIELRAVFINCEPDLMPEASPDFETKRFQREELFKHNALRNCNKKLALTLKLASDVDDLSDDYIPVEHVSEGSKKKRVRLLNPYVLRLRREPPIETYKLRKINNVFGLLTKYETPISLENTYKRHRSKSSKPTLSYQYRKDNNYQFDSAVSLSEEKAYHRSCRGLIMQNKYTDHQTNEAADQKIGKTENERNFHKIRGVSKKEQRSENIKETVVDKRKTKYNNTKDNDHFSETVNDNSKFGDFGIGTTEEEFAMYEIGNSSLWHEIHVQLFEKINSPDGKNIWNDVTKDQLASVSSSSPEWIGPDVIIRYRPTKCINKDEFSLPKTTLRLLTPINSENANRYDNTSSTINNLRYIVVPVEDVVSLDDGRLFGKEVDNISELCTDKISDENEQGCRRVKIRLSRALLGGINENLRIKSIGKSRYLTIPHRRTLRAQIDLEARADQNQLISDGSSGRVTTAVADNTKQTRTIISLLVKNTGLVSSHFRLVTRNCIPEISNLVTNIDDKSVATSALVVIPPMHNKHFQLELPIELPCDSTNCSVALLNEDNASVAVRDIIIKKGDRCFCVWHCDCICLSDDPKLLCREMSEVRQAAAGISTSDRIRRIRSVCYKDCEPVNFSVVFIGALVALLFLGFVKGIIGLYMPCVASWGINRLIQTPRRLDHYYESSLKSQEVKYDQDGWPVHPVTKKRTVRFVSRPMGFILNLIFFVCVPCLIVCDVIRQMVELCNNSNTSQNNKITKNESNTKKCFSSHDIQNLKPRSRHRRRHGGGLHRWMTPQAETLSADLWQKGLHPEQYTQCNFATPLLQNDYVRSDGIYKSEGIPDSHIDSEQEDTQYVLMQMQKSRESLTRSQKKLSISGLSSVKIHGNM